LARDHSARLSAAEGRKFGLTVGAAFLVLAAISFWRGHRIPVIVLGAIGTLLVLSALVIPRQLGPVERGWMRLAEAISKVTTPIFMGVVYFLVLTPVAAGLRLVGHRALQHQPVDGSYWRHRPAGQRTGDITRQF
jgi:hypothetical protein